MSNATTQEVLKSPYRPVVRRGRPVPGYLVDELGTVWSLWERAPGGRIAWRIGETPAALVPYPIGRNGAYLGLALRREGRYLRCSVHTLVMEAFHGPPPAGMEVLHGDGNGHNNALANLRYGTRAANQADKITHGTYQFGERNPSAKLTDEQADQIRRLRAGGMKLRELAVRFGVAESAISRIANGKRRAR